MKSGNVNERIRTILEKMSTIKQQEDPDNWIYTKNTEMSL